MCFCVFVFVYLCIFHKHVVEMGWLQELCLAHMKTSLQSLSGLSTWLWLCLCVFTFCHCNCKTQSGFCCTWLWWDTGTTNCVSQYEKLLKMTSTQLCLCLFQYCNCKAQSGLCCTWLWWAESRNSVSPIQRFNDCCVQWGSWFCWTLNNNGHIIFVDAIEFKMIMTISR